MKSVVLKRLSYEQFLKKFFPLEAYYNNLQIKIIKGVSIELIEPVANNVLKTLSYSEKNLQHIISQFNKLKDQPMDENLSIQFTLNLLNQENKNGRNN